MTNSAGYLAFQLQGTCIYGYLDLDRSPVWHPLEPRRSDTPVRPKIIAKNTKTKLGTWS